MENRKTVLLTGVGDILYINGVCEDDENFYSCGYKSQKTGTEISVRVPIRSCIKSERNDVDLECVSMGKREQKEGEKYKRLSSLNFEADYSYVNVWVHVKKIGLVKVFKTTKKSVHFVDKDGKNRYTAAKNIRGIYNYSPEKELPNKETQKKQKRKAKKIENKSKKIASIQTENNKIKYIQEVPEKINYRNRQVFIDINENKRGLKVKNVCKGKVFWKNLETGQCSAILLKKVNGNNNIVVYEYI